MARISNRNEFKCYVLRKLGAPVLDLVLETSLISECSTTATTGTTGVGTTGTSGTSGVSNNVGIITTPTSGTSGTSGTPIPALDEPCASFATSLCTQLDLAIDDALDYFQNQASNIGNEKAILYVTLENQKMYYNIPSCVVSIEQDVNRGSSYTFDTEEGNQGVGLFSIQSQFGPRGIFDGIGGSGSFDTLLTYEIAMEYNALINLRYTKKFTTEHQELNSRVFITPTPSTNDHGKVLMYICDVKIADEKCFNHLWVQRYATALTMEQIGRNLSMYTGMQLPGGGQFNADFYWSMGREDKDKLEEELASGKWGNPVTGGVLLTG